MSLTRNYVARSFAPMETEPAELLNVGQAAELLGLAPRTVQEWIAKGKIVAVKLGPATSAYVITRAEIERVRNEVAA